MIRIFIIATLAIFPFAAFSKSQVGRSVVDGQSVTLFSDGSWIIDEDVGKDCKRVTNHLELCIDNRDWKYTSAVGDFQVMLAYDAKTYAGIIVEEIGDEDGVTSETMRKIALEFFAEASELTPAEIPVYNVSQSSLSATPVETMVYGGKVNNLPVIYSNTILVEKSYTAQFVSYRLTTDYSIELERIHEAFLAMVQFRE